MKAKRRGVTRRMVAIAGGAVAIPLALLSACVFSWTLFGPLDNPNDPKSYYFADYTIEVLAGIGAGPIPDDGPGTDLFLSSVGGMTARDGYLYVADTEHHRIIKIKESDASAVTIAGTGAPGYSGDGGVATSATLFGPTALVVSDDGIVYVLDYGNNAVRAIAVDGTIATYANLASLTGTSHETCLGSIGSQGSLAFLSGDLLVVHDNKIFR
ncbi:MAG: hypothetical protein JXM71_11130, partial [Spirochaetales bacterium]|nr:hypothetical protein [Spirochaetales bacterium]